MAVTLLEAQDLVALLHRGTLASDPWQDFLIALRRRLGAREVLLFLAAGDVSGGVLQLAPGKLPRVVEETEMARLAASDGPLRAARVFSREESRDHISLAQREALDQALTGLGLEHARMVRVDEPGGASLLLLAGQGGEDFTGADVSLLATLADHLEIALRTWKALEQERLRAGISGEAVRRLNFGWFVLDTRGVIIDHSEEAGLLLRQRRAVQRSSTGRLVPELRSAQGALRRYLEQVARGEAGSRAIHLSDEPWLDMLLTMRPAERAGSPPVVAAYVHGEQPTSTERSAQLQDLFGLTAKEAQLALLISRGVRIAEAAGQIGLTVETARLYSKRVYAKTGTRGQADLVRLVLASIVALG
ncbi:helix-turn-helix transcriptional regulator [Qipengyuania sp. CAU 1752]